MLCPYLIDIGDHWSFHHRFDASTLYRKPRKDQCLNHLQKNKVRKAGFNGNKYVFKKRRRIITSLSNSHPALVPQVQQCSHNV